MMDLIIENDNKVPSSNINEKAKIARKILNISVNYDSSKLSDEEVIKKTIAFKAKYPEKYKMAYNSLLSNNKASSNVGLSKEDKELYEIFKESDREYLINEYKSLLSKMEIIGIDKFKEESPNEFRRLQIISYVLR